MNTTHSIRFKLDLSYEQYASVYRGTAKTITTLSDDGRRILFPAIHVRRFVTPSGIHGHFEMELTDRNQFIAIRLLSR